MDDLQPIFDKLNKKKELIIEYEDKFNKLDEQKDNLSSNNFFKEQKKLYKEFQKQMKIIEKIKVKSSLIDDFFIPLMCNTKPLLLDIPLLH